jgi:predicted transcriptional regulator
MQVVGSRAEVGRVPALGDLEAQVMRRIWVRGQPVTVRDIVGDLRLERPVAYTTVMTVMDNLRKKGWLRRKPDGRAYRYEPLISDEEYSAGLMRQALEASNDRPAVLMHFIGELSAEEADALHEAYLRLTGNGMDGSR